MLTHISGRNYKMRPLCGLMMNVSNFISKTIEVISNHIGMYMMSGGAALQMASMRCCLQAHFRYANCILEYALGGTLSEFVLCCPSPVVPFAAYNAET